MKNPSVHEKTSHRRGGGVVKEGLGLLDSVSVFVPKC